MKILIVDDDPNTVQLIEDSIEWKSYDIDEVYTAYHGKMAMEIVEQERPDLIVSDIEMPQMDGIHLLEQVAALYEEMPEFVFLTCHNSFTFAQKAIEYQASAYLLKPFRMEELTAVISKAVLNVKRKKSDKQMEKELLKLQSNEDYVTQNFFLRLLNGSLGDDLTDLSVVTAKREIHIDLNSNYYVIYAGVNIKTLGKHNITEAEFHFIFRNLSEEIIYDRLDFQPMIEFEEGPWYIVAIVVKESFSDEEGLKQRCIRLTEVVSQYLSLSVSCVISPAVPLSRCAEMKRKMDIYFRQNAAFHAQVAMYGEDVRLSTESGIDHEQIKQLLRDRKKTELIVRLRDRLQSMEAEQELNAHRMQMIHHDLIQIFYGYLYENNIQAYRLFQDETSRMINDAAEDSTMDMIKYLNYMYDQTAQWIQQSKESTTVISRVKSYVKEHYSEQIGRDEIAASVFLAPNYLSTVFHEETGITLREYINQCRIDEAKRLMVTTNISVTDIALRVGFENIPYFSTVFKKMCGMTPAAWKKEKGQVQN